MATADIDFAAFTDERALFRHEALPLDTDSIRCIRINPPRSTGDETIDCEITHTSISRLKYACLSYTWGVDDGNQYAIQLNGRRFFIRRNLWDFLNIARRRLNYCLLWIDAICIDQTNVKERNHQVQQMGEIYHNATMVVSWLGNDDFTVKLLEVVGQLAHAKSWSTWREYYRTESEEGSQYEIEGRSGSDASSLLFTNVQDARDPQPERGDQYRHISQESAPLFITLRQHSYWRRAWITQELLLAKAVVLVAGDVALDFPTLLLAYLSTNTFETSIITEPLTSFVELILVDHEYFRQPTPSGKVLLSKCQASHWSLMQLLKHFQNRRCAIPRDRVYALLGLCTEGEIIKADYDATTEDLFSDVLEVCSQSLCFCSPAILARSLDQKSLLSTTKDAGSTYATDIPQSIGIPSTSAVCPTCSRWISRNWEEATGLYFCLKGRCGNDYGHLLWDLRMHGGSAKPASAFYFQPSRSAPSESRLLCVRGAGIDVVESRGSMYTIQFSLDAVIAIWRSSQEGIDWGEPMGAFPILQSDRLVPEQTHVESTTQERPMHPVTYSDTSEHANQSVTSSDTFAQASRPSRSSGLRSWMKRHISGRSTLNDT